MTSLTYPELAFYAANAKSFRNVIGVSSGNQAVFGEAAAGSTPEPIRESINVAAVAPVLWPDQDALGKSLPWGLHQTVIGVVRNASTAYVSKPEPLEFYLPPSRSDAPDSVLLVRVSGSPRDFVRRLQDTARDLDARLQPKVQVVTDTYEREVQRASAALAVIGILGTVAILLSVIGLAGLAGYTVAQRTREIGLRIALGARPSHVVRAILAPMIRPVVIGFV